MILVSNGWNDVNDALLFGNVVIIAFGVPFGVELDNRFDVRSHLLLVVEDGQGDKLPIDVNEEHACTELWSLC